MIRLNKYLANAGVASRRKSDQYIAAGFVKVNGKIVRKMGVIIDENVDEVFFQDQKVKLKKQYIYILLNKPERIVTTADDEFNRKSVLDLVNIPERVYPVGRLDYETTGALLLTDNGDLTHKLLHPNYKIPKIYRALIDKKVRPVDLHKLRSGVDLEGIKTLPCKIEEIRIIDNNSFLEIELLEGRNRQIRLMFELQGYKVEELDRFSFAGLTTLGLHKGE